MANKYCVFCQHYDQDVYNADKEHPCSLLGINVSALRTCPGWKQIERTSEETARAEELLHMTNKASQPQVKDRKPVKTVAKTVGQVETDFEHVDDKVRLYDHQIQAREKFRDLDEIALFFEMGCGKTLTSMMIMCDKFKAGKIDSLLIVAPNDVHRQWFDDLCNDDSVLSKAIAQEGVQCVGQIIGGRGGQKEFYDFDDDDGKLHIVCTNIDLFSQPMKWKVVVEWANAHKTAIIIDEATVIKNSTSKRSQRMLYEFNDVVRNNKGRVLASRKKHPVRCVLTGTPVTNGPIDLWAIMEFVRPNYFNRNEYAFSNYYGMHTKLVIEDASGRERSVNVMLTEKTWQGIKNCRDYATAYNIFGCSEDTYMTVMHQDKYVGPYKHAEELRELLQPVSVFAKLTDCVDMPEVNEIVKHIPLSDAQQRAYDSMKNDLLAMFDDKVTTAKNKLVVTLRLQQISSGFIMAHEVNNMEEMPMWQDSDMLEEFDIKPDEVTWLGDTNPRLEQLMRDVDELDRPILILTRFSAEAAKVYDMLKDKYSTCLITGWKNVGSVADYKAGKYDVMVANTNKIARGHNLQNGHVTLFYSNTYSMELRQQAMFRTFRIGQKEPCSYVDYVSCGVDQMILDSLKVKKNLLEYIREKNIKEEI